ncbi:hypothetical protein [Bacillus thuringiensis]|uniref:hypothetical protein n=1 Tax=Bacillus thuringiensis TaxID=1428 RepID=UPI000BF42C53|nr:hypothetical protein [Bacillus thuringiensis]PES39849.1 hypothetical protein CN493_04390 [Bacillus thuringiensis]
MKKKKVLSAVLSLGLAFGVGVATLTLPTTHASAAIGNEAGPFYITDSKTKGIGEYEFNVPAGYGHVKCYFYNAGESTVTISLKHESGKEYIFDDVKPNKEWEWKSNEHVDQGVRGGKYFLQISSGKKPTKVKFAFKASDVKWR